MINLAVSTLSTLITSLRSNEAVTAELVVVEPLIEIGSLTDVEQLPIADEKIDSRDVISMNREGTEGTETEPVQLSVSFIQLMRVEFERKA